MKKVRKNKSAGKVSPEKKINKVLTLMRPYIQSHGGDVEFISLENGTVFLQLSGACATCPLSTITLRLYIEKELMKKVPEVKRVEEVK